MNTKELFKIVKKMAPACGIIAGLSSGLLIKKLIKHHVAPGSGFSSVIFAIGVAGITSLIENAVYRDTTDSVVYVADTIEAVINKRNSQETETISEEMKLTEKSTETDNECLLLTISEVPDDDLDAIENSVRHLIQQGKEKHEKISSTYKKILDLWLFGTTFIHRISDKELNYFDELICYRDTNDVIEIKGRYKQT